MRTLLPWAIGIGTLAHLVGAGSLFTQVVGSLLTIGLLVGAFGVILGWHRAGEVLGPVIVLAIGAVMVPSCIAGILAQLWAAHPVLLLLAVVGGGAALGCFHWARPQALMSVGLGAGQRSGGGKAVPLPRRWR